MDIQILFQDYAGPDVKFVAWRRDFRDITIKYTIPRVDPAVVHKIRCKPANGLHPSIRRAIMRAAERARVKAYMATGDMRRDFDKLSQGKLADEHPRSDPQAAPLGAAAALPPES